MYSYKIKIIKYKTVAIFKPEWHGSQLIKRQTRFKQQPT